MPIFSRPLTQGSRVHGVIVPFPDIVRLPGEPSRVRLSPEGRIHRPEQLCPQKFVNFSLDGTKNVVLRYLAIKPSTLISPGCVRFVGVFAKERIPKGEIVTEYGGRVLSRAQVEELRKLQLDTHIKPIIGWQTYLDSRWTDGYPANEEEPPPISMFLHGHYLAGLMNSAYYKYDCNCEFTTQECQEREDMPGLLHTSRLFTKTTKDVEVDEELLVHYGHDYFEQFGLPKVRQS